MSVFAGAFLAIFGALISWLLAARYPAARFMRLGYGLMTLGGLLFVLWSFERLTAIGLGALAVLLFGGIFGIVGAVRKELRMFPPV